MTTSVYLDRIIGHLGAAAIQRSFHDDKIIADHIEEALAAAQALKAEITTRETYNNGDKANEIHSQ